MLGLSNGVNVSMEMKLRRQYSIIVPVCIMYLLLVAEPGWAYIGPGAGFAFLSSFLVFIVSFILVGFYLLSLPVRIILRAIFRRTPNAKHAFDRVVIVGFDGMDPKLTHQYMQEGNLPNLLRLRTEGVFTSLATTCPSISPAAWSTFMTGVDPSYHNIFDFITRDPNTYAPKLSSASIGRAARNLTVGNLTLPLAKPKIMLLRKSQPFWKILGQHGIFSSIIHIPITFPPEKFNGLLLSGMCTPDLVGSQGTFTFFSTADNEDKGTIGGVCVHVEKNKDTIDTHLYGPENPLIKGRGKLATPLKITFLKKENAIELKICGKKYRIREGEYTPWVKVVFKPLPIIKIRGICRFYLKQLNPALELYVTPINIDPEKPALPISHPFIYSVYLAKLIGLYATLGLAEDTWALNEGVIDENAFLKQAYLFFEEREKVFLKALERTPRGLCACVFDTTDRLQHMFFRCLDEKHPANRGREVNKYRDVIKESYQHMDNVVGKVLNRIDDKTLLMVISDHGFAPFRRGVNLNTWLYQNGYLHLKDGRTTSGDWFEGIDWQKTKAYSLGLAGIFINRKGRESLGTVEQGGEVNRLKYELISKLTGIVDQEKGEVAIRNIMDTEGMFKGPYRQDAVDLLVGYNTGYRNSWACATGRVSENVFEDNTRPWSGDHCVDPELVPGIFFSNREINRSNPNIRDIAPTVLQVFGVNIPGYIQGTPLFKDVANK